MSNEAMRDQLTEVLGLVQKQMADIAAVRTKQAKLTVARTAADGLVEVTVNAHGQLLKTVIDETYLDEYEFDQLADHITEAAQAAFRDVAQRVADMMAPIGERRRRFPSLAEIVDGAPDLRNLAPSWPQHRAEPRSNHDNRGQNGDAFPTLRR
ncbi:YbaB/EbfC family nucleoid-associated protein [Mycolicibacterium sp. XJ870]